MATATTATGKKAGATKTKGTKSKAAEATSDPMVTSGGKAVNLSAVKAAVAKYAASLADPAQRAAHLEEAAKADGPKLVGMVRKHLEMMLPAVKEEDRLVCEECGEISTEETDFCPFCGDGGLPPEVTLADRDEARANVEASDDVSHLGDGDGMAEAAAEAQTGESIELANDAAITAKIEELDAAVARIKALQAVGAGALYDLGVEIRKVNAAELWKARGHGSFKDWVEAETGISRASAYSLMDIVKDFDRDTYLQVGRTKLALVAGIEDPEKRAAALEAAKGGASARDLERAKKGEGEAPEKEDTDRTAPGKSKLGITLTAKVDGKPVVHAFRSITSGRPIKAAKDDSYVEIPIGDGAVQRITLARGEGGEITGLAVVFVKVD